MSYLRVLQTAYVTAKAAPVIRNSVYWKAAEMAPGQVCYTGLTNCNSRGTYNRWLKSYCEREKESLPPAYAVQMRETSCYDSSLQYLSSQMRWRDGPMPSCRSSHIWQQVRTSCFTDYISCNYHDSYCSLMVFS
ncbi:tektin bundle-interacting protein 1-like isoform X2 [Heptranchias perlo]|uniref:tektin bundle-interacting protein 1-like isoform X2 n=1 Tax=Heptranchias perlo TaxID=212740 RepID=UPI0035596EF4